MTKVSTQTFARDCKKRIQLGETLRRFLDLINRKCSTLILKMTILINCAGKFCYRHRDFQNTEAATKNVLKNFTKFIEKRLCEGLFFNILSPATLFKKRLRHRCFSKYENLYDSGRLHLSGKKLFWKYLENIQKHISIGLQVWLINKFRKTGDWLNPHND